MNEDLFRRRWLLISLTFVVVVTFVARLAFLQLLSGDYKPRAENNAYYILSTIPRTSSLASSSYVTARSIGVTRPIPLRY